jgi:hypothetical protein
VKFALALSITFLCVAASAAAQDKDSRLALRDYADCVVSKKGALARRAVIEDWSNQRIVEEEIPTSACMMRGLIPMQLRAQGPLMKFAIAEALWRKEQLALDATRLGQAPPLTYRMPPPVATHYPRSGKPLSAKSLAAEQRGHDSWLAGIALAQFGECVLRSDSAGANALLATKVASPEELAAIQSLSKAFSNCLKPGQTVNFNRASLRGPIAAASYRLASALNGSSWTGDPQAAASMIKVSR